MQVPIISGIYTDQNADFRTAYPVNMIPVPKAQGISNGYLRPSEGVVAVNESTGGIDRGGINWNDKHYRVIGAALYSVTIDGALTNIGAIDGVDRVRFTYSFDRLAICANKNLFYYDGATLTQVTDSDLGDCLDVVWVDGYFMTTDGENLVVTELNDPMEIDPFKYGSSEIDPDPVRALHKVRNEIYAVNRNTIEIFNNIGGGGFPFSRVTSAQITRGAVSRNTTVQFEDSVAFLGSRQNESLSLWIASSGNVQKISTREIDQAIANHTEAQHIQYSMLEVRLFDAHKFLYVHLPDETFVYDFAASQEMQTQVWHKLSSGVDLSKPYDARNFIYVYNKWFCGHRTENKIGYLTNSLQSQWGNIVGWSIDTTFIYNENKGAIVFEIELVSLTGNAQIGKNPSLYTRYTLDGINYSMPKHIYSGKQGDRTKRIVWRNNGKMKRMRSQKFVGNSDCFMTVARLDMMLEPLSW